MKAEITKILDPKESIHGNVYIRVFMRTEKGEYLKTDLCRDFRNWKRWKNKLKVGNVLTGLRKKDDFTIDADSFPEIYRTYEEEMERLSKLGVF